MMLLNVGPRADGTITEEEKAVLKGIGRWLSVNGEGLFDTIPWKAFGEGKANVKDGFFQDNKNKGYTAKDFRFTYKNGSVYAFWMKPSKNKAAKIKSFKMINADLLVKRVTLLENGNTLQFERNKKCMEIRLPDQVTSDLPLCFKIEIE